MHILVSLCTSGLARCIGNFHQIYHKEICNQNTLNTKKQRHTLKQSNSAKLHYTCKIIKCVCYVLYRVSEGDINCLLRKRRPDVPLEKKNVRVTFQMIIGEKASKDSKYIALINENEGVFSLASVYEQTAQKHKATFNFILPGRYSYNYNYRTK